MDIVELGQRSVRWDPVTGRPWEDRPLDPLAAWPARSRWPMVLPEGDLWRPEPLSPTPDGHRWVREPLGPGELAAWRAMNGARTTEQVAEAAGVSVGALLAFLRRLTAPGVQAAQLRRQPVTRRDRGLEHLWGPPRPPNRREEDQWRGGETALGDWHGRIASAEGHFDHVETTLAYAFGIPHPALRGRTYGQALAQHLGPAARVLEIGPGSGEIAAAWLQVHGGEYTRLDRSPALLAAQAAAAPGSRGVVGDALALPFEESSFDLVICNEVIADLPAGPDPGPWPVDPAPGQTLFNVGAFALVQEIRRVLAPGGRAWISEFGDLDERPEETTQLDHPEVSVNFSQLGTVAERFGLEARLGRVPEILGFNLNERWISRPSWEGLRALWPDLPARAWTLATLPRRLEGAFEVALHEDGPAPIPTRVWALEVRRAPG